MDIYPEGKKAGEGGAFSARGDHCCQVTTPTTRDLRRQWPPSLVLCGAERAGLAASPNKLFPYPTELGKAIVDLDLDTKKKNTTQLTHTRQIAPYAKLFQFQLQLAAQRTAPENRAWQF